MRFSENGSLWNLGALGFGGGLIVHFLDGPEPLRIGLLLSGAGFLFVDLLVSLFITEEE